VEVGVAEVAVKAKATLLPALTLLSTTTQVVGVEVVAQAHLQDQAEAATAQSIRATSIDTLRTEAQGPSQAVAVAVNRPTVPTGLMTTCLVATEVTVVTLGLTAVLVTLVVTELKLDSTQHHSSGMLKRLQQQQATLFKVTPISRGRLQVLYLV
jgi:hypothetical protein